MATRKNKIQTPKEHAILNASTSEFSTNLEKRIEFGEEIFNRSISNQEELRLANSDYKVWTEYNYEMLKQSFNIENNDYMKSYDDAGYTFMGQMGEVLGNPIETHKNLVKYKLDDLKSLFTRAELLKSQVSANTKIEVTKPLLDQSKVFIVHGHDDEAKEKVARFISKLGFDPIILHEQASSSRTIIEKIEDYGAVGFAIILYTPCDLGKVNNDKGEFRSRARQNVVLEHGYFIGRIGRPNVLALVKGDIETPNDISGVVYTKLDDDDAWHLKVAKELNASGYKVDLSRLL